VALLSLEEEMARADLGYPFVNDAAFEAWMQIWCDECIVVSRCPLVTVGAMNRTPAAWTLRDPAAVNKYTCAEFVQHGGPWSTAEDDDDPTVVIESGEAPSV
jgi:hypothetical protein